MLSQTVSKFLSTTNDESILPLQSLFSIIPQYKCQQKHGKIMKIWISLGNFKVNRFQLLWHFLKSEASVLGWKMGIPKFYHSNCSLKMLSSHYCINSLGQIQSRIQFLFFELFQVRVKCHMEMKFKYGKEWYKNLKEFKWNLCANLKC